MPITTDILNSFKNNDQGLSARRLTAFTCIVLVVSLHFMFIKALQLKEKWAEESFIDLVIIDFIASAFFLGLVTAENIVQFKNGGLISKTTKSTQVVEEITKTDSAPGQ